MFDESFNQEKSAQTKATRGIDFVEARDIWDDPQAIEGPATSTGSEERWLKVGKANGRIWTVGFTIREEGIRIFMVRPARNDEKEVYLG